MESATVVALPTLSGGTITEIVPYEKHVKNGFVDAIQQVKAATTDKDALEAVKLDPAVLEAQVKMETRKDQLLSDNLSHTAPVDCKHQETSTSSLDRKSFEELLSREQAALLALTPQQFHLLMKYVDTLRKQRTVNQINLECAFCKNNGESFSWYSSHALKDWRGRVLCPVLRAFRCPRCGATGDRAHTIKYCPEYHDADLWSLLNNWP